MTKLLAPFFVSGEVVKGFGRGSKQLGIRTANIDTNIVKDISLENGVYYGFSQILSNNCNQNDCHPNGSLNGGLEDSSPHSTPKIYPMVCSIGYNPHFNNTIRSLEIHLLHKFDSDFYGSTLRTAICGYIRAEQTFDSLDQLIKAINNDIEIAKQELKDLQLWSHILNNEFFQQ